MRRLWQSSSPDQWESGPTSLRGLWMSNEAAAQSLAVLFLNVWSTVSLQMDSREVEGSAERNFCWCFGAFNFLKPLFKSAGDERLILDRFCPNQVGLKKALEGWMLLILRCTQTWFDLVKFTSVVWQKVGVGRAVSINCRSQQANKSSPQSYELSIFCHYLCHYPCGVWKWRSYYS